MSPARIFENDYPKWVLEDAAISSSAMEMSVRISRSVGSHQS